MQGVLKNKNSVLILILLASIFLKASFVFSYDSHQKAFARANSFYEQGRYEEAIKEYEGILASGWESGNLYYNLGNCYFKKGKLGWAIFYYEKARRLLPQDKDLEANYEYAISLAEGRASSAKRGIFKMFSDFRDAFSIDALTILVALFYYLVLISILVGLFWEKFKRRTFDLSFILAIFFVLGIFLLQQKVSLLGKEAIVIEKKVEARFEPLQKADIYFTLYEGTKVRLLSSKDNWWKIKRDDGKSGWVEKDKLAVF